MQIFRRRATGSGGFERPDGMPEPLHRLLCARGVSSVDEARRFLKPDAGMLSDPALFPDMARSLEMIRGAKNICVYGDYDVDGVCASVIMSKTLEKLGIPHEVYLPSRHDEGYGLNESAVRAVSEKCDLLLTVDCGITSAALVSLAEELGMRVIVTDHHLPGDILPDCPVLDPFACGHPSDTLCGAGVAFKLSEALIGREAAMENIDLAALATVADIVPLTGESRVIAKLGLAAMNRAPRAGIKALADVAGISGKELTSGSLGFQIGPRLNASGRLGSARRAYELLSTSDSEIAGAIAAKLDAENSERKKQETAIVAEAEDMLAGFDFMAHRAIVLAGESWNAGVIGLAASRLAEKYNFPAILISMSGDTGVGSCRSIRGIDIHAALCAVGAHLLKFGGHAQAAGLTVERGRLPGFISALDAYLSGVDRWTYVPVREYDDKAEFREFSERFIRLLDGFAPTGMGNPAPVFMSRARVSEKRRVGRDNSHLSLRLTDGTNYLRGVAFRKGARCDELPEELDVLYTPKLNDFGGNQTVELEFKALSPRFERAGNAPLAPFLTEVLYNTSYTRRGAVIPGAELARMLESDPQGTLVIAADAESAPEARGLADVFIGKWPDDPRRFNAVCVRPAGARPEGYKNVVWCGMPAPDGEITLDVKPAKWVSKLPGIDELRRAYVAIRDVTSRPHLPSRLELWAESLTQECALDIDAITASIIILTDMGLIEVSCGAIRMTGKKKSDPTLSRAFQTAIAIAKGGAAV